MFENRLNEEVSVEEVYPCDEAPEDLVDFCFYCGHELVTVNSMVRCSVCPFIEIDYKAIAGRHYGLMDSFGTDNYGSNGNNN